MKLIKPLHEFLEEKFGKNWDKEGDWRSRRGGKLVSKKAFNAAVKEWQKANEQQNKS